MINEEANKVVSVSERQLQKLITDYIKLALPGYWYRNNIGGLGQRRGIPDLEVMYRGQPYFIEVKTSRGRLSRYQQSEIAWLRKNDIPVCIARSLNDVVEFFDSVSIQVELF